MVSRVLRRVSLPLVVAALVALAGLSLDRVYNGQLLVQLVIGAAVGSVLVSAVLRRAPAWLVAPLSVLALFGYAACAVSVSARAGGVPGDLPSLALDAARNAVPRLLTALIPVEPQPDTVLAPVVLAWLAGFAGAELVARASRPALALLPPTLLYVGALVLVGPNADVQLWQPLAFAGIAAAGLVAGSATTGAARLPNLGARERTALRLRTFTGLASGLAAVLAVVVVVSPLVANVVSGEPTDPRRYVQPPNLDVLDQNPLIRLSGWAANPDQPLFDVEVIQGAPKPSPTPSPTPTPTPTPTPSIDPFGPELPPPPPDENDAGAAYDTRLRLAILPDWDGVTWHMDADFRNAGRVLPPIPAPPGDVKASPNQAPPLTIEERITVDQLRGRLLPAVSAPSRVDGIRIAYDQTSGSLLNNTPLLPGTQYTVTSLNPSVDLNLLQAADVPDGDAVARYLAVGPKVPTDLSKLAEQIVEGESSPYLRALAIQTFLAEHYAYAVDAPSGHSYPNLNFFLFGEPRSGGQRGTSEQFATAFATLGRLLGLPTRVVVGFQTPAGGGTIHGKDGLAWPEVLFEGAGWVAFDPIPQPNSPPRALEDQFIPKPPPPSTPPPSLTPPPAATYSGGPPAAPPVAQGGTGPRVAVLASATGGGLLGLFILALLVVMILRALQTRGRLRSGSPPNQVMGAWDEVLDALILAGRPAPKSLAVAEVAGHAAQVVADAPSRRHARNPRPAAPALDELARKVNTVAFAGGTAPPPDDLAGMGARAQAIEYSRALYTRRSWWRRLLWRVDPRPLRRRP
jgi:transglutaminase-like putative cysteine protease